MHACQRNVRQPLTGYYWEQLFDIWEQPRHDCLSEMESILPVIQLLVQTFHRPGQIAVNFQFDILMEPFSLECYVHFFFFFFFVLPLFSIPHLLCKVYTLILVCKRVKAFIEVCRRSNSWSLLLCATNANIVFIEPATNNTFFDLNSEPHWVLEALIRKL